MTIPAIAGKLRGVIDHTETRRWRTNILCAVTLILCVVMAGCEIWSGHSYFCALVPIIYAGLWNTLHNCTKHLASIALERDSPDLTKLESEIHSLVFSTNFIIIALAIFFIRRP